MIIAVAASNVLLPHSTTLARTSSLHTQETRDNTIALSLALSPDSPAREGPQMVAIKQHTRNTLKSVMEGGRGECFRHAETLETLYKKG